MTLTKQLAKQLLRDFVPDGKTYEIETLRFHRTKETEVFQCCRQTSHDPQSGPIYCGQIAEYVTHVEDGEIAAFCARHSPPKHLIDE